MKRSKLFLFALVIALCSIFFCGINFKAATEAELTKSDDISILGAQVRTADPMGIRFVGTADTEALGAVDYYGIVIAFGELGTEDVLALTTETINGYSLLSAEVTALDEDNQFYISLVNIPSNMYGQKVTARAYVKVGEAVTYSSDVVVRSFNKVVKEVYESGAGNDKVAELYSALPLTTFEYNGGSVLSKYEFTATRFVDDPNNLADDFASGKYLTIASKENVTKGSNRWWYRLFLKSTHDNLYKIVDARTSGEGDSDPTDIEYDYVISAHADAIDTVSATFVTNFVTYTDATDYYVSFEMPTTQECDVLIKVDKSNTTLLLTTYYEDGDSLPTAFKEHYKFAGWCSDAGLEGETTLAYNGAEKYYAAFIPNEYSITYELNGGSSLTTLVETYTVEDNNIVLPTLTEMSIDNGIFVGWYDNADFEGEAITSINAANGGNITLYAKWDMISTDVTFEMNGGERIADYNFVIKEFKTTDWTGKNTNLSTNKALITKNAGRIFVKYNSELELYESISAVAAGNSYPSTLPEGTEYILGAYPNSFATQNDLDSSNVILELVDLVLAGNKIYFNFGTFPSSSSTTWSQNACAYTSSDLIVSNFVSFEENVDKLPKLQKAGYTFVGWFNDADEEITSIEIGSETVEFTLNAKFNVVDYTISWDLNGGTCSSEYPVSYNIESETIVLPTASEMTLVGAEFVGWANASGEIVTEITKGSTGNLELTAQWMLEEADVLEISDANANALNAINSDKSTIATIIVNSTITSASKYVLSNVNLSSEYTDVEYVYGSNLFASVADALAKAEENAIIYVFDGTYSDALTISVANVTLAGTNYGIKGNATRNSEANITGLTDIAAEGVIVNGFKFSEAGNVKISANNVTFACSIVAPSSTIGSAGSNRKAVLVSGISTKLTGVSILDNYLDTPGTGFAISTESIVMDNVSNCFISGNYITNSKTTAAGSSYPGSQAMIRFYTVSGTLNITNNEFAWGTYGYSLEIANTANSCTEINIIENVFNNNGAYSTTAGINIRKGQTTTVTNIIGNKFYNVTGSTILATGDNGSTINIKYNLFGEGTAYKTGGIGSATLVFSNNYYAAAQTTATSDVDTYSQDAAGLAQYEADYSDYKAQ